MDGNPYAAPASTLDSPTQGTVSMVRYGVLCFVALLVILAACVLVSLLAGVPLWQGAGILCLLASIQLAGWRFVRTHRRVMSPLELKRFALACAAAFWLIDEVPALIRRWMSPDDHLIENVLRVLIASVVDVAIAAAIVYVTMPAMAQYFMSSISSSAPPIATTVTAITPDRSFCPPTAVRLPCDGTDQR